MEMTGQERIRWLAQINRIHTAQKLQRMKEAEEQTKMILAAQNGDAEQQP